MAKKQIGWINVSSDAGQTTWALALPDGCLVRVVEDGRENTMASSMVYVPGASVGDLRKAMDGQYLGENLRRELTGEGSTE